MKVKFKPGWFRRQLQSVGNFSLGSSTCDHPCEEYLSGGVCPCTWKPRFPLLSRTRAEDAISLQDCSGRFYGKDEREDLIRSILEGAEIQRDKDEDYMLEYERKARE